MVCVGMNVILSFSVGVLIVLVTNSHRYVVVIVVRVLAFLGVSAMLIMTKNLKTNFGIKSILCESKMKCLTSCLTQSE